MMDQYELIMEESRKKIFELQKNLMVTIMDYQIKYGSNSIAWNVNVNFITDMRQVQAASQEQH